MYTTYHLASAQEVNTDLLDAIKAAFKSKPITIIVEEDLDTTAYLTTNPANKNMLDKAVLQDKNKEHILIRHDDL